MVQNSKVERDTQNIWDVTGITVQRKISGPFQETVSLSGGEREQIFMEYQMWALSDVSSFGGGDT